jgi:enterochelin esterase-like enzyme
VHTARRLAAVLAPFGLVAAALAAMGMAPTPATSGSHATASRTVALRCPAPSLGGELNAVAYLPSRYAASTRRYPVIYFLHGLPAGPHSYTGNRFVAATIAGGTREAIVVTPQGARTANSDPEYLNRSARENWPRAIATDLTRCVDARFRTIARRSGRALVGLSAGGYGAMNIGLRHMETYGAVESWSGYFAATDPTGHQVLDFGSAAANAAARVPSNAALTRSEARHPTFIGFYVGSDDTTFLDDNLVFHRTLARTGIAHRFAVYRGGHSETLWASHAADWLDDALDALAAIR